MAPYPLPIPVPIAFLGIILGLVSIYPNGRVLTWLEFFNDGLLPKPLCNACQDVLGRLWVGGFRSGVVQKKENEVLVAISECLQRLEIGNQVVEIAAGSGRAAAEWTRVLRENGHPNATLVLTDLHPHVMAWDAIKEHYPFVTYVKDPIDATDLEGCLNSTKPASNVYHRRLRMMNLALHHFEPDLAKAILRDVIRTKSMLVSGDLAPNRGGVLWNWLLTMKYAIHFDFELIWNTVKSMNWFAPLSIVSLPLLAWRKDVVAEMPWWMPVIVPFIPLMAIHDSTVSVLRAYSIPQLQAMVDNIPGGENFEVFAYYSRSFGEWLGLPFDIPGMGLGDPVIQYFILAPKE